MAGLVNGIFNNPAFTMESLTDSILKIPFMPSQARGLGIFLNEGISTTSIDLEYDSVSMTLIPAQKRGGPAYQYRAGKRTLRNLNVPHFPLEDTIKPEEIQNVREFGSNSQLRGAQSEVNRRLRGMAASHDALLEYQSIGAVKGVIYDADGTTVIYNLFTEYGIAQPSFDFVLGDATTNVKRKCLQVKRTIEKALGGMSYNHIHCFCGNEWFDAFVSHADVAEAYKLWQANGQFGAFARDDNRSGFAFAGITFENYVGAVTGPAGAVSFVAPGEAHFFPVGVPSLFRTVFAPAAMWETVNTIGLPRYARGEPLRMGRGIELLTESNVLSYCTRPETLVLGTTSSYPAGIALVDDIQVGG